MIWIILLLGIALLFFICGKNEKDEADASLFYSLVIPFVASSFLILIVAASAITYEVDVTIPQLETQATMTCNAVEEVRKANYLSPVSKTPLIEGSIENIKQSTNLTLAITACATHKTDYNKEVIGYQKAKKSNYRKILGFALFIPKSINQMQVME